MVTPGSDEKLATFNLQLENYQLTNYWLYSNPTLCGNISYSVMYLK